jgi:hypothetical protein
VDEVLEIESIDVSAKSIRAKGGTVLKFSDLGTGQGQGAYLEGLLSINDDRKVIALLDEVAMMDTTTLGRVAAKLRDLHSSGKLLAGIIVQKADDPATISLLE